MSCHVSVIKTYHLIMQFIHQCNFPHASPKASEHASSPHRAIYCFLYQFKATSVFVKVIQYQLASSSSSSHHFNPSHYLSFDTAF